MPPEVAVRGVPESERYEAFVDGMVAGFAAYRLRDGEMVLVHTDVDDAFEGAPPLDRLPLFERLFSWSARSSANDADLEKKIPVRESDQYCKTREP